MTIAENDWLTVHRVRFASVLGPEDIRLDGPEGADCWRFCPSCPQAENGLPTFRSDVWGGLAIHRSRESAEAVIAAPADHLPFLADSVEAWHALLIPYSHRGEVNWRGHVEKASAIGVAAEDPGGPLAVVTTAGYVSRAPDQIPRIADFVTNVNRVVDYYGTLPGNLRRVVFSGGFDGRDGFTFSLWKDDAAMLDAAYGTGFHREQMDRHRAAPMADRTSFTRARIAAQHGSWPGEPAAASA